MGKKKRQKSNIDSVLKVIHGADKKRKKNSRKEFDNDINAMLGFEDDKKKKHNGSSNDVEDILTKAVVEAIEIIGGEPADTLGIIMENMNNIMEFLINEYLIGETVSDNNGIHTPATIKECALEPISAALLLSDNRQVDLSDVSHADVKFAETSSGKPSDYDRFVKALEESENNDDKEEELPNMPFSNEEVSDYLEDTDNEDNLAAVFNTTDEPKVVERPREVKKEVVEEEKIEEVDVVTDSDFEDDLMNLPKVEVSSKYGEVNNPVDLGNIPIIKKETEKAPVNNDMIFTKNRKGNPL